MVESTNTANNQVIDWRTRVEVFGTVLLSVASLVVAWCTYQSTLWNGEQDFRMAEANIMYRRAQEITVFAAQQKERDVTIALSFVDAVFENRRDKISYYLHRTNTPLTAVLTDWFNLDPLHNTNAPASPLQMPAYQRVMQASQKSTDSTMRTAEALWQEAKQDNTFSDSYTLFTVIFSIVMFLCGVCTKLTRVKVAYTSLIFAASIFLLTLIILIVTMPVAKITP
ncbi:hypothetical protein A4H97_09015 [Niastella yeongjuensis]|uniref:DUF4337 domain-containing protein n=1 Tax=Niastella yeongjuensis TaxID=354355 RepID=A0A1V9EF02_9BACT|nr:hypothetical protein [Niastella yeongjuensis]OQP44505.1 hypothetical protein A4H97_09015 [Niastella yeongjuensis]SEO85345.1 hypothetical protein SAMN05660816_03744 [Niastella yeongjuensis]